MRIGITGSHGTGKTTLAKELGDSLRWNHLPLIEERARIFADKGLAMNQHASFDTQLLMLLDQTGEENAHSFVNGFISDRILVDYLVYSQLLHNPPTKHTLKCTEELVGKLLVDRYDAIFFLPICFDLKGDNLRPNDRVYQTEVEDWLNTYFDRYGLDVITLVAEDRLSTALNHLTSIEKAWYE